MGRIGYRVALLTLALALSLAACGSGDDGNDGGGDGSAAPAPGEALSVEEALASTLAGPLLVQGFIVARDGEPVRLCDLLAESYPPQCGGASLVVEGLDLDTVEGLTRTAEPDLAQAAWSEATVSVLGEVADGVLTVSETSM